MSVCPACGADNRPGANFCKGCRSPLGAAPQAGGGGATKMCHIGHIYPANLSQCPYCPSAAAGGVGGGKAGPTRPETGGPMSGKAAPTRPPMSERARPAAKATKIASESRPLAGWLVVLSSRTEEVYRDYRLYEGRNKIGRGGSGAAVQVNDEEISAEHAVLTSEGEEYYLTDVGSGNGTFVNGAKVRDVQVSDGDMIRLGKTVLVLRTFQHRNEMG